MILLLHFIINNNYMRKKNLFYHQYHCNTHVWYIVAAVLLLGTASTVLAVFVLERPVVLSYLLPILQRKL